MIETTVASLITIKPILQQLANTEMSAKDGFMVLRLLKIIDKEYDVIESTQLKMLEKYGEKDDSGNYKVGEQGGVLIKEECAEVFSKEMESLLNTKITLNSKKLPSDILAELPRMTPNQLLKMEDFIEE